MIEIDTGKEDAIVSSSKAYSIQIDHLVVDSTESEALAAGYLQGIKSLLREIEEVFGPPIKAAHAAWKAAKDARARVEDPVKRIDVTLRGKIAAYAAEQKRQKQLEEQRIADEIKRRQEEQRLALAAHAEAAGDFARAAAEMDKALGIADTNPTVDLPKPARAEGISTRTIWSCEVHDFEALVRWVLADFDNRRNFIQPQMVMLNHRAVDQKREFDVPGCVAVSRESVSVR